MKAERDEQLADAVGSVTAALRAGLSVPQSLAYAAAETPAPLGSALGDVVDQLDVGVPLETAVTDWADRAGTGDARLLAGVIRLHRRSGGDLPSVLDQVVAALRERRAAAREVRALTAQARLSGAILGFLPIGFFAFLWLTSRRDIEGAFRTPGGPRRDDRGAPDGRARLPVDPLAPGGPLTALAQLMAVGAVGERPGGRAARRGVGGRGTISALTAPRRRLRRRSACSIGWGGRTWVAGWTECRARRAIAVAGWRIDPFAFAGLRIALAAAGIGCALLMPFPGPLLAPVLGAVGRPRPAVRGCAGGEAAPCRDRRRDPSAARSAGGRIVGRPRGTAGAAASRRRPAGPAGGRACRHPRRRRSGGPVARRASGTGRPPRSCPTSRARGRRRDAHRDARLLALRCPPPSWPPTCEPRGARPSRSARGRRPSRCCSRWCSSSSPHSSSSRWCRCCSPPCSPSAQPRGGERMLLLHVLWFRASGFLRREEGQTTAEYALVILAAAAVAVVLIAWAHSSGKLPAFFDQVIDNVMGNAKWRLGPRRDERGTAAVEFALVLPLLLVIALAIGPGRPACPGPTTGGSGGACRGARRRSPAGSQPPSPMPRSRGARARSRRPRGCRASVRRAG